MRKNQEVNGARALLLSIALGLGLAFALMLAAVVAPASAVQHGELPSVFGPPQTDKG